jgi:hypothetical protein
MLVGADFEERSFVAALLWMMANGGLEADFWVEGMAGRR